MSKKQMSLELKETPGARMKGAPAQPRRVITRTNYVPFKGKVIQSKSLTIQSDTLTVAELLKRHIQGMPLGSSGHAVYTENEHEDIDMQQFQNLDPVEQEDVIQGIQEMTKRLKIQEKELKEEIARRKEAQEKMPGKVTAKKAVKEPQNADSKK